MSDILKLPEDKRNDAQKGQLRDHFRNTAPLLEAERKALAALKQKRTEIEAAVDRCLVTVSNKNLRTVRILPRGDWQNESGEVVLPATPKYLPAGIESTPENRRNRLDLANWLTNPKNPLTARVQVNRLWKLFYGNGIVKTLEDMGTQSELPEHLALLDWLACEFMDSGWDIKHMVKLMVSSRIYAQSSRATPELLARDPQNRELARGGRWRLDAEFIRDNALAISGLLVQKVGGRSVNPYQPAGYWENLNFPTREWPNSKDENQWRRGLYTWWQRRRRSIGGTPSPVEERGCRRLHFAARRPPSERIRARERGAARLPDRIHRLGRLPGRAARSGDPVHRRSLHLAGPRADRSGILHDPQQRRDAPGQMARTADGESGPSDRL